MKKQFKVFKVWFDDCGYDEYDAFVVIDESVEAVRSRFIQGSYGGYEYKEYDANFQKDNFNRIFVVNSQINNDINNIHIEEVDLTQKDIIIASFNAG